MKLLKRKVITIANSILLFSLFFSLTCCSPTTTVIEQSNDQTMKAEDFFDLKKTHKPTEEEVLEIQSRIKQQWEQVIQLYRQKGSPKSEDEIVDFIAFADEEKINLITFTDVVDSIGRPHQKNPYTGICFFEWETTTGEVYDFSFSIPRNSATLGESEERDYWIYAHYGIA